MSEQIARLRIELEEIRPRIWRTVEVPTAMHLKGLHDVIQIAFDWWDSHLHEFEIGDRLYGIPPEDDWPSDRKVYKSQSIRLRDLIGRGVHEFIYVYDFGDNWRHHVAIQAIEDSTADGLHPRFVTGARRAPPEDVGGVDGFQDFLEAMLDPAHEEHEFLTGWYGGPFDPDDIDAEKINAGLGRIAKRRRQGKEGYLKSKRGR